MTYVDDMRSRPMLLCLVAAAGCHRSKADPVTPAPETAALCADLERLTTAAATNFADQRTATPVQRGGDAGFELKQGITGARRCAILHADPSYPDDMIECDLGEPATRDQALAVVATWTERIGGCPVVATWFSKPRSDGSHAWELETKDDHLLEIKLGLSGDDDSAQPRLQIRRPEI